MAVRDSVKYASIRVNAPLIADPRDEGGRAVPITFEHTVVSGELGGASAGASDEVNLCVVPAHARVVGFEMQHNGVGASAGSGATFDIGDTGDPNRLYATGSNPEGVDEDIAGSIGVVAFAGMHWTPTVDTVIQIQWGVDDPVVGQVVKGTIWTVPGS